MSVKCIPLSLVNVGLSSGVDNDLRKFERFVLSETDKTQLIRIQSQSVEFFQRFNERRDFEPDLLDMHTELNHAII